MSSRYRQMARVAAGDTPIASRTSMLPVETP